MPFSETDSLVRVTRYVKQIEGRQPVTNIPVKYEVELDWGIGEVDGGSLYIAGAPHQLFPPGDIAGTPVKNSRILVTRERLALDQLEDGAREFLGDRLHWKYPNI